VLTPRLKKQWDTDGWCVVEGAIPAAQVIPAQSAVRRLFPSPAEMADQRDKDNDIWRTEDAQWPEFPFHSSRPNALVLHDNVISLAQGLLESPDIALYMGIVSAKHANQSSGYNQLLHADYPNHTLVVPRHDVGYRQVEFFIYLTDVTVEDGATRFVSRQRTAGIPVERHTLSYEEYADLGRSGRRGGTSRLHRRLPPRRVPPLGRCHRSHPEPGDTPCLLQAG
jgi:hypothetical protein